MPGSPIDALSLAGSPTLEHIDLAALDGFRFADGAGYPPSYRAFVRHSGWARAFGLWLIYPPVLDGYADGVSGRGRVLTQRLREEYRESREEGFDWVVEPDGDWELVGRLEVFGWSENGDLLLWETTARDASGEFPIWESARMQSLHRRGTALDQVFTGLRERAGSLARDANLQPLGATRL